MFEVCFLLWAVVLIGKNFFSIFKSTQQARVVRGFYQIS